MPELPEVETVLRGVAPHIEGRTVAAVTVRQAKLRQPVPETLGATLAGETVLECSRRAKYLLIRFATGVLLIHLGMSGSLKILLPDAPHPEPQKHDHLDIAFSDGTVLRYRDPRRFGLVLWFAGAAEHHPLLAALGPEPLTDEFDGSYLHRRLSSLKRPVKTALMDNAVVVGVGNIYANESLFAAGIRPDRAANSLSAEECEMLASCIKTVLERAIAAGGSTLRDFTDSSGHSGYFQQEYAVYGRQGQICPRCGGHVEKTVLGQRGTFFCAGCQH